MYVCIRAWTESLNLILMKFHSSIKHTSRNMLSDVELKLKTPLNESLTSVIELFE